MTAANEYNGQPNSGPTKRGGIQMAEQQADQQPKSLADKLGDVKVGPRSDVKVSRHLFRGEACYILHDPVSFQSHRLAPKDYAILSSLHGDRTLNDNFASLVEQNKVTEESREQFFQYIVKLQALGLLNLPITDGGQLFERYKAIEARKKGGLLQNLMFWKIPLVNPDAFLDRTLPVMKVFYSRGFFVLWLALVAAAGYILFNRWNDFMQPMGDILALGNLPYLWFSLIGLKIWHEFGHAYACKKFGGNVPDMGALLFVMTPCAYVDASASWGFPERRHRLIVSLGGMYFESIAACLAVFVWSATSNGLINSCAHHIVVLSSVITVLFNANPLMRYDGYYVLSDLVGIPNLRAKATLEVNNFVKLICLGIKAKGSRPAFTTWLILFVYGICAAIYRTMIILSISMMVAQKFFLVGLWLGGSQIVRVIGGMYKNTLGYLWRSPEMQGGRRALAFAYSAILLVALPAALYFVPIPGGIETRGFLSRETEQIVRSQVSGFLNNVRAEPGTEVAKGEALFDIANPEVSSRCRELDAKLAVLRRKVISQRQINRSESAMIEKGVTELREQANVARRERDALVIRSETDGELVTGLRNRDQGNFVQRGERLGIVWGGDHVIRGLMTAEQLLQSQMKVGDEVECQFIALPGTILKGKITQLNPAESNMEAFIGLTQLGGGDIVINPMTMQPLEPYFEFYVHLDETLPAHLGYGSSARVLLARREETVANYVVRKTRVFLNQLAKH